VTGEWCMLLKTQLASPLALQALLDRIRTVPNVQETMMILALSALHDTGLNGPGKASRSCRAAALHYLHASKRCWQG
jgi:Lrp/AsnC ligand binding domain